MAFEFDRRTFIVGGLSLPLVAQFRARAREVGSVMVNQDSVWRRIMDDNSFEYGRLEYGAHFARLSGSVFLAEQETPMRVDYVVECDDKWRTRRVALTQVLGDAQSSLNLTHDGRGNWRKNGEAEPGLEGCLDVDLGISPSTNALPVNRLRLDQGRAATISAAWVKFPELSVAPAKQVYERTGVSRYRYQSLSSGFQASIDVDEHGSPVLYEGVWRRLGVSPSARNLSFVPSVHAGFAGALIAPGPSEELAAVARDFGWLAGGWTAEVKDFGPEGKARQGRGEWWFAWVLEGRAMQDVWIAPPRGDRERARSDSAPDNRYGSTIRYFDKTDGKWRVSWLNPVSGVANQLSGRAEGNGIVLLGEADHSPIRWSFRDIAAKSFLWIGERRLQNGEWVKEAEFKLQRI